MSTYGALSAKELKLLGERLDKVYGALRRAEMPVEELDTAAHLLTWALGILDKECETDAEGEFLPEHQEKARLGRAITDWLDSTRALRTPQPADGAAVER